ncbi:MAG TPA: hypothetical protein VMX17_05770 [Candidatus Glassbacteria bacterium]|nr:hypothetical protein [Candidatus Glassbacteria bacterium]
MELATTLWAFGFLSFLLGYFGCVWTATMPVNKLPLGERLKVSWVIVLFECVLIALVFHILK